MNETASALNHAELKRVDSEIRACLDLFETPLAKAGTPGPLTGVPVAIKDNICLDVGTTTCGSRMLERYQSPFTATAAQRLLDAGAQIVCKTNLDEFAMGSSCEHSGFVATRNPWDPARVPGGSSGGSAAAVASGMVRIALGSDTGGSVRQPAALCGVVGLKPTYGRVSRLGLVAFASSLDQIGPITQTVEEAARVLSVISGFDPGDSTSVDRPEEDFAAGLGDPIEGLTIGVAKQGRSEANHPDVNSALDATIKTIQSLGGKVVEVDLPHSDAAVAAYYIVSSAEASSNLARYDGVRYGLRAERAAGDGLEEMYVRTRSEGFGEEVKRRIMLGTHVLSSGYYDAYYLRALKARRLIKQDYDKAFAMGCHAVLMPTAPNPAFPIGAKTDDPLALYLEDVYTVGASLAGLPAISVPAGFATVDEAPAGKLPIGMQLIGPAWGESTILRIAHQFEQATSFHEERPPIFVQ